MAPKKGIETKSSNNKTSPMRTFKPQVRGALILFAPVGWPHQLIIAANAAVSAEQFWRSRFAFSPAEDTRLLNPKTDFVVDAVGTSRASSQWRGAGLVEHAHQGFNVSISIGYAAS
jgi:hypothetical protein